MVHCSGISPSLTLLLPFLLTTASHWIRFKWIAVVVDDDDDDMYTHIYINITDMESSYNE